MKNGVKKGAKMDEQSIKKSIRKKVAKKYARARSPVPGKCRGDIQINKIDNKLKKKNE